MRIFKNNYLRSLVVVLMAGLSMVSATAQEKTVTGKVVDDTGEPVIGASIIIVGTTRGTVTDIDGNYTLTGVPEDATLRCSFIGYTNVDQPAAGQTTINFNLASDALELDDVVVVGYGQMKKTDVTGSIASVSTEKLVAKGATSVMENLQGSVPGVNITQSSGRTNGGFNIEIRGKSSTNSDVTPIYVIDGVVCSDMDFLNPQDIERVDVLKDASSTAIYGSRATAGVIMITTKGGAAVGRDKGGCKQKFNVTYDGYYGVTNVARKPDFFTGDEFYKFRFMRFLSRTPIGKGQATYHMSPSTYKQMAIWHEAGDPSYDGTTDDESYSVMLRMIENGETVDWIDEVTQTGKKQNHYIAASGSTDDISYHFGIGYTQDEGVYIGDKMTKYNFKGSLDTDLGQYVSAGFSINGAVTNTDYANDYMIQNAFRLNPLMRAYDKDGNINQMPGYYSSLGSTNGYQFSSQTSPLYLMQDGYWEKERVTYRAMGNVYLQIKPMKGLSIKTTFAPTYTSYRDGQMYYDPDEAEGQQTSVEKVDYRSAGYTWTNIINFNRTFAQDHSLDVMVMEESSYSNTEKTNFKVYDPMDNTLWYNMGTGTFDLTDGNTSTSYSEGSMVSVAGRLNYSYRGKYMLTGTIRWDGSSKFADGNRWGSFPSFAAAWRLSEEEFMKFDWLTNLKLRLSYGVTGNNSGIGSYATQQGVSEPGYYAFGSSASTSYHPDGVVDSELSWESSKEINVGLDFGFLNNRINGTLDIYKKNSEDLLYDVALPLVSGGGSVETNVGEVENRGVELSVTGIIIERDWLHWEVTANFAKNTNEVVEINGSGTDLPSNNLFIGESVNNVYIQRTGGIVSDKDIVVPDHDIAKAKGFTPGQKVKSSEYYNACYGWYEGQGIVKDLNGDGSFDDNDKEVVSSDPDWTGSLSTTLSSHGFDLSASLYTKQGYTVYSNFYNQYMAGFDRGRGGVKMDYYIPAGTIIDCDGINADGTYINPVYQQSTHYGDAPFPDSNLDGGTNLWKGVMQNVDASYVKVKNITLGYSLAKKVLDKIHLQKARIYCTVTNPFAWSDYKGWDAEWANASLKQDGPSTITWEFGLNLKF